MRLGTLVTGITYRNVAHLGKIVATLDVLSGGRAVCGLGLAWFADEHRAYGWEFPATAERYALLEDALQLLPMLWGPGGKPFDGRCSTSPRRSATRGRCRSTCRCSSAAAVSSAPCGWPRGTPTPPTSSATSTSYAARPTCCGHTASTPAATRPRSRSPTSRRCSSAATTRTSPSWWRPWRPRRRSAESYAALVNAGTVADQVGRCRELVEAGVAEVVVRLPDIADPGALDRMGQVIDAFR